ncbi:MAG: helix-turn-helix transcriptional regulator [Saprospiraceae bacterium]|nr:helix-turn-helix transcriptional regulator [Saprospiraceae bacterium]MCB0542799.1 helix-turn-helix transcriptional regulator [Saprospiraceae bacterium]MCB0576222.1 helix-turn-helix transcriptional regulator [Saprospiraceae bacterium]MCB9305678.1 helix-turn-helix transcriptional regulator [Lewinellaceae bacterium]MCB9354078.1 helix-turn-helix transcriptional regulator [Lewinellaceae bacterium]
MPYPPFQFLLILVLGAATLHGCYLSVLIFLKNKDCLLGIALAGVTAYLLNYLLFLSGIIRFYPDSLGVLYPFMFLSGPAFFLSVKKALEPGFRLRQVHCLHLLPLAYGCWRMWPVYNMPAAAKEELVAWLLEPGKSYPLQVVLTGNVFIYVLMAYTVAIWHFARQKRMTLPVPDCAKARWYVRFSVYFTLLLLLDMSVKISFSLLHLPSANMEYVLAGLIAVSLHLIGYHALGRTDFFPKIITGGKYKTSPLDAAKLEAGKQALLKHMETEKPYLDTGLRIADLAEQLGMPSHHLSHILSESMGMKFSDFVNDYRVSEVLRRLSDERFRHLSIEALGTDCGFSSKTTFLRAFKKRTGITPGAFLNAGKHG